MSIVIKSAKPVRLCSPLYTFWGRNSVFLLGSIYKEKLVKISSFSKGPMKDRFRCVSLISGMTDSPFRSIRSLKPTHSQMLPDDSHNFIAKTFGSLSPILYLCRKIRRAQHNMLARLLARISKAAAVKFHSSNTMEG